MILNGLFLILVSWTTVQASGTFQNLINLKVQNVMNGLIFTGQLFCKKIVTKPYQTNRWWFPFPCLLHLDKWPDTFEEDLYQYASVRSTSMSVDLCYHVPIVSSFAEDILRERCVGCQGMRSYWKGRYEKLHNLFENYMLSDVLHHFCTLFQ